MTHKEFSLLMKAKQDKVYDQLEMYSINALMIRRAYHDKKRLKATDLFKRPSHANKVIEKEDVMEEMKKAQEYLSQFENFNLSNSMPEERAVQNGDS